MPLLRWLPLALITVIAFWLRSHDLGRRPMHADEGNQAVKFGELLDTGHYAFDPRDHHGPTLYFAAVPVAWLRGEHSLASLNETTVRLVPALFGTASVVLLALVAAPLGFWAALAAAAFLALSPPAVYYSRYFIQETLLVTFTLAAILCARSWWTSGLIRWAVATGISAGFMQATKGSAPLFMIAAGLAVLCSRERERVDGTAKRAIRSRSWLSATAIATGSAIVTAALLYSSFGQNRSGLADAFAVYTNAFSRFGTDSAPTGHEKPWWYYLRLFGWYREGGLVWHQIVFSTLALAGVVVAIVRRDAFLRWMAFYTLVIVAAFSIFPYKTPWHVVHFIPGLAVLAASTLAAIARLRTGRLVAVAFTLVGAATLYQQTWRASFLRPADPRNPYAYVHSSPDVLKYRGLAEAAIARSPTEPIRVIAEEYWPLPWYFRGLPHVGYWSTPPPDCDGALVIASATQADSVRAKLHRTYRESFLGLRPGVICILFTPEP